MGSKSAGPGMGSMPQGDVPAFDMPPTRTYTPEEWSKTFGPNVEPDPRVIRQGPQTGGPMMPFQPGPQMIPQGMGPGLGGQGPRPQMSPDDTLRMLYQTQLGRAPEQGGMDYWHQRMAAGMTPDQVRDFFRASQEGQAYQQRMRPMTDNFSQVRPQMSPEDTLRRLYMSQLGRAPDQGGMNFWREQMAGGKTPDQIRDALRSSQEGQAYQQQRPTQPQMSPEVRDALRLAMQSNPRNYISPEDQQRLAQGLPVY